MSGVARMLRLSALAVAVLVPLALAPDAPAALPGVQHLHYRAGPFEIKPGQNRIAFYPLGQKPPVDGYIVGIKANLRLPNGTVPRVDVIHLHHGVWLNLSRRDTTGGFPGERFFAVGEEKTVSRTPPGYGYPYRATDVWFLNHMIHDLTPKPFQVYVTYDLDFIPATSPAAAHIIPVHPVWMDVENGHLYPVFDVRRGTGGNGRFTFPTEARNPYPNGRRLNTWTVDRPGVLVGTGGHLHPGGLHDDLFLTRPGARYRGPRCARRRTRRARRRCRRRAPSVHGSTVHLFRSSAHYFEPAGAVSWDVAMTVTRRNWRVGVKKGDRLKISATYDSKRASWYEVMGIMNVWMADGRRGPNPFRKKVDLRGRLTHGHLRENRHHGGARTRLPDPRKLPSGVFAPGLIGIQAFKYAYGDLRLPGARRDPPVVRRGGSLLFVNGDNRKGVYHSITSCRAPCNRSTGIAYPIADGRFQFDSGQLGTRLPAVGRLRWRTPRRLRPGTYTYFCRIHPFMRGSFRVAR